MRVLATSELLLIGLLIVSRWLPLTSCNALCQHQMACVLRVSPHEAGDMMTVTFRPHRGLVDSISISYLGLRLFFSSLSYAGAMPGPVLFGYVLDHSCLLWEKKCERSGSCLYYDNHQMAWLMMAVCAVCKVLCVIFGLTAWRIFTAGQTEELPTCASDGLRTLSLNRENRMSIFDRFHTSVISDSVFAEESELNAVDVNHANHSVIWVVYVFIACH